MLIEILSALSWASDTTYGSSDPVTRTQLWLSMWVTAVTSGRASATSSEDLVTRSQFFLFTASSRDSSFSTAKPTLGELSGSSLTAFMAFSRSFRVLLAEATTFLEATSARYNGASSWSLIMSDWVAPSTSCAEPLS